MSVQYQVLLDIARDNFNNTLDVTGDIVALNWSLGVTDPQARVSTTTNAQITLHNTHGTYAPEISADWIGVPVHITINDGAQTHQRFSGRVQRIRAEASAWGQQTTILEAIALDFDLQSTPLQLPLFTEARADDIIGAILTTLSPWRATLAGYCMIDEPAHSLIDSTLIFADVTRPMQLAQGVSTFIAISPDLVTGNKAWSAVADAVESDGGFFAVDRTGTARFINRHQLHLYTAPLVTFTDDLQGVSYQYGEAVVSQMQMMLIPRHIGEPDQTLYTLFSPQTLEPYSITRLQVTFRDATGTPVSVTHLNDPIVDIRHTPRGGYDRLYQVGVQVFYAGGTTATVEFQNAGANVLYLQKLIFSGTPVMKADSMTLIARDARTEARYGGSIRYLQAPFISDADEARARVHQALHRHILPAGVITRVEVDARQHPQALTLTLFDVIHITTTPNGHSADYRIIGERHQVSEGGMHHRVQWVVLPIDRTAYIHIDQSMIDDTQNILLLC